MVDLSCGSKFGVRASECRGQIIGKCLFDDGHPRVPMEIEDCIDEPKEVRVHDSSCYLDTKECDG
jgi:hypothetical protein